MTVTVRPEQPEDFARVEAIHLIAFGGPNEAQVIVGVRKSAQYNPAYSLVGVLDGHIAGHILFSHLGLQDAAGTVRRVMVLGPLAVHPEFQRRGVGAALIAAGVQQAEQDGEPLIVVRGWDKIYGPFGFRPASEQGVVPPGDLPAQHYLARPLSAYTPEYQGTLRYPAAFAAVGYPVQYGEG